MENLKKQIEILANEQKTTKPQRKTETFVGERTLTPYQAQLKALRNKEKLRSMYVALGLLNGLEYAQIESNPKEPFSQTYLDKLVETWKDSI